MNDALVIGGPSALAAWGHAVLRDAASLAARAPEIVLLDREDDPELPPRPAQAPPRLLLCHFPSPALIARLRSRTLPAVAFLDDPYDTIRYHRSVSGATQKDAIRAQSLACSYVPSLAGNDRVVIVRRDHAGRVGDLIRLLLERLQFFLPARSLEELIDRHTSPDRPDQLEAAIAKATGEHYAPLEAEGSAGSDRELVRQALVPVYNAAHSGAPDPIVWPHELFFSGDQLNEPLPALLEVTGGARVIVYGPYMYLPPGLYQVSVLLAFSAEAENHPFGLICVQRPTSEILYEAKFTPPGGGLFSADFPLRIRRSNELLEILIRTDRGAIEGRFSFLKASFVPESGE